MLASLFTALLFALALALVAAMIDNRSATPHRAASTWRAAEMMALVTGCILCAEMVNCPAWSDEMEHLHAA